METNRAGQAEPAVEPGRRPPPLARRERVLLMTAAAALQVIAWLVILQLLSAVLGWGYDPRNISPDVAHYADVATRVLLAPHQWPYSAFRFEYPPLSILLFILPPVAGTLQSYHQWFAAQMIAIDAITAVVTTAAAARIWNGLARPLVAAVALAVAVVAMGAIAVEVFDGAVALVLAVAAAAAMRIWNGLGRPLVAAVALALAVVAMGAIAVEVFDGAVALVLAVAVLCLVYRRWTLAALTIGLGFGVKLMPIVLLPLVLVLARTRRSALWALLTGVVAAVVPFMPFLVHDEGGVRSSLFGAQIGRGLQIESVAASPYLVAELIHRGAVTVAVPPGGSLTIAAAGTGLVERLAPLTVLLLLAVVYRAVWHAREELRGSPEGIPVAALAAILAAMCGNKVLSPQHLLWILPLVALCLVSRELLPRIAAVLLLCAMVLTQVEFPGMYYRQIDLDPAPLMVISARNGLLLAAFALTVAAVWRLRSPEPAAVAVRLDSPPSVVRRDGASPAAT